ncbi:MAG: hypothetical protein ACE5FS_02045 [Paracoccaceae bacterium]
MNRKVEKLVQLALGTETVDEAIAALRQARKLQPTGSLKANHSPDWEKFEAERERFDTDRAMFEEERTAFHRRILAAEKDGGNHRASRGPVARACRTLAGLAGLTAVASVLLGSVAFAMITYNASQDGAAPGVERSICGVLERFSLNPCGR